MAQIQNPKKRFNFTILIPGVSEFLVQKVTLPDFELEEVTHGDFNHDIKTAGRAMIGKLTMSKLSIATGSDSYVMNYLRQIQDVFSTGGDLPSNYKIGFDIIHYAPDGVTEIDRWIVEGAYPSKISGIELDRQSSENTVEEVEWSVDKFDKVV